MTGAAHAELLAIAAKLRNRGTELRPPADKKSLAQLESALGGSLGNQARALLSVFDGFAGQMADNETMVCLWSADAIRHELEQEGSTAKGQLVGDYFLAAEMFRCDLRGDEPKVWWDERGTVAASSLLDFCREIGNGTFGP